MHKSLQRPVSTVSTLRSPAGPKLSSLLGTDPGLAGSKTLDWDCRRCFRSTELQAEPKTCPTAPTDAEGVPDVLAEAVGRLRTPAPTQRTIAGSNPPLPRGLRAEYSSANALPHLPTVHAAARSKPRRPAPGVFQNDALWRQASPAIRPVQKGQPLVLEHGFSEAMTCIDETWVPLDHRWYSRTLTNHLHGLDLRRHGW